MPQLVIVGGLGVLALLALAALRAPAPRVSETAWRCASTAAVPVALLWMVSLTVCARPSAFAVAMTSGAACCAVAWVMRAPPPERGREHGRPGRDDGPGDGDEPPGGPPDGGDRIDWDAFERAAYEAWRGRAGTPV